MGAEARDVVDVSCVSSPTAPCPNHIVSVTPRLFGEGCFIVSGHHPGLRTCASESSHSSVTRIRTRAIHIDPAALEKKTLAVVRSPRHDSRNSRNTLDLGADLGVLFVVLVLGPAVESPIHQLDPSVARMTRVGAESRATHGRSRQSAAVALVLYAVCYQQRSRTLAHSRVVTKDSTFS